MGMYTDKICAVVVTFNRITLLKECLFALENSKHVNHIIIVNNNSSDGTSSYLEKLSLSKYIIINSSVNLGGAGGFALGVKKAYECTTDDYFWIMDDDTIPNLDASDILLEKANFLNNRFGFLCSNVRWTDGSACNVPRVEKKWSEMISDGLVKVSHATFVSVFFRRQSVRKYGIPTKELFIWGDDTEFTIRISQHISSYFVINSIVTHKTENNVSDVTLIDDTSDRISRYYYLYRNLVYISKKYKNKRNTLKMIISNMMYALKVIVKSRDNNVSRFCAIIKGTISGLIFNPKISRIN